MDFEEVTDPNLLSLIKDKFNQTNSDNNFNSGFEEVTDPSLLKQLNSSFQVERPNIQQSYRMKPEDFSKGSDIIRDMIYGMGISVGNIGKTLTGGKPDISGINYRKQNPSSAFNNSMESQLDKFGNQITPSFQMPDIRSKNSNPTAVGIGQVLPFALAGGASFPGMAAAGGAYGATQYEPGQQEWFDSKLGMKSNRLTNTIEDAVLGILPKGISKVASTLIPVTKKSMVNTIWNTHDALENRAAQGFKEVSKEAKNRGIDTVPMEKQNFNIEELEDYFPKTKASKKLLSNAATGNYDSLRKLQTDLYTRAKKNLQSDFEAERDKGEEMLDKRNDINQGISEHLKNTGNADLSDILDSSRKDWRTLQDVYYNRNLSNSISKLVDEDIRKVPKNLTDILEEDSKPMKKFREFHPGLESELKKHLLQKKVYAGGLGASGLYGAKMLYNNALDQKQN